MSSYRSSKKKYILVLFLGEEPVSELSMIKQQFQYDFLKVKQDTVLAPDEFLDIVEHAELVLTDSFHVTIFSIIYEKPFINFVRSGLGASMNSRFETLYRMTGVENRTWKYLKSHISEIWEIDFEKLKKQLEIQRKQSLDILMNSLNFVKECNIR